MLGKNCKKLSSLNALLFLFLFFACFCISPLFSPSELLVGATSSARWFSCLMLLRRSLSDFLYAVLTSAVCQVLRLLLPFYFVILLFTTIPNALCLCNSAVSRQETKTTTWETSTVICGIASANVMHVTQQIVREIVKTKATIKTTFALGANKITTTEHYC